MVIKIFLFLIFLTSNLFAECTKINQFGNENTFKNLEYIHIELVDKDKFFKRASRYYISVNSPGKNRVKNANKFQKNYKKKMKSFTTFKFKDGTVCNHNSTIRGHGDVKNHIEMIDGVPISSYRIKLQDGNINNITRFILFRPKVKYFDNEIFVTTLLKELGFLTPRTYKVKVKINNVITDFIFQENLKKEFLEHNKKIEGPILEADEDFLKFNKLTAARISNKEWIKNKNQNYIISLNALKNLNFHRFNGYSFRAKSLNYKISEGLAINETLRFDKKNLEKNEYKKIGSYQALIFALDASHGLSFDDQRFYYDPIFSTLEPIYYDGDPKILSIINYDFTDGKFKKNLANWKKLNEVNLDFDSFENKDFRYNLKSQVVTLLAKENSIEILNKLKNLNQTDLLKRLQDNGIEKLDIVKLNVLLNAIEERLVKISKSKVQENLVMENNIYKKFEEEMGIEKNLKLIFFDNFVEFNKNKKISIEVCDYRLIDCEKKIISEKEILKLLEQKNIFGKNNIFVSMTKKEYANEFNSKFVPEFDDNFESFKISQNFNFIANDGVKTNIDETSKKIFIEFTNNSGKIVIFNSILNSWKIFMTNKTDLKRKIDTNTKRLTGCLSVIDSQLKDIEIYADNFFCEDSVNIIRSNGSIKKIDISNAFSDALDLDFSNISILNLNILNAKNDCADLSFGNYKLISAKVQDCGDKSVSVGEKSTVIIDEIKSENSNIGLASKDSSKVFVKKSFFKNQKICLAAYKKKQEFQGASIELINNKCEKFNKFTYIDKKSKISINNKIVAR